MLHLRRLSVLYISVQYGNWRIKAYVFACQMLLQRHTGGTRMKTCNQLQFYCCKQRLRLTRPILMYWRYRQCGYERCPRVLLAEWWYSSTLFTWSKRFKESDMSCTYLCCQNIARARHSAPVNPGAPVYTQVVSLVFRSQSANCIDALCSKEMLAPKKTLTGHLTKKRGRRKKSPAPRDQDLGFRV